ncbi:MAG: extracellular solute-binding protein [Rhodobacteraceae bacterium]|nr:extracellular solute-binding protein [Paracoccaceae bacterium]MCY4195940.1 extracellular solute-binding protein [Paracoccaceae bacterium]MCY4327981.1 extracellular solute-binding protein [Paracoccaceae bacterium]
MRISILGMGAASMMAMSFGASAQAMDHSGVTVEILTRPGPVIAQRLVERGEEFGAMTGAEIRVNEVPFAELFQKILTDWATGTNSIDVGVFASGWATELVDGDLVEALDDYIANDSMIDIDDIAPYFREYNQKIGGKTYLITVDGDFQMIYYRKDVLDANGLEPPRTWPEYLEVASQIHGQDMNGDGEGDFGSCIFKKRNAQSYFAIGTIAASLVQSKGTGEGIFFNNDDMTPKINNEAWQEAFRLYKATGEFGPPDELNHDIGDTRALVQSARCGLAIDWGDIGPLSIDDSGAAIRDKMYAAIAPGSTRALNTETGKLEDCNPTLCPYAVDGINYAPYAAFGGWSGAINKKSAPEVKQAAYDFLSYVNQAAQSNVDVTIGWTGYNPYRNSQLDNPALWIEAGFSPAYADNYLGAIKESLNHPNMASDMKIPGAQQYTGVILDRELARFLAGEITAEQATANIEEAWEEITEDFGRESQRTIYNLSLGITN